jgi:hypothetical protein
VGVVVLLGIGAVMSRSSYADTNLVNEKFWVVTGTDDLATNASSISVSVKKHAMGSFSELAFSYNTQGTNVLPVCVVKGSGEIKMAVPTGPFGGSFFLTSYWDCNAGFVPAMVISNLDIRLKGGKAPSLDLRGKISNGVSMAAKDFELRVFAPDPELMEVEVRYTLTATKDFCVDDMIHTNRDNFQAVRFVRVTNHTCVLEFCKTTKKSFCYALTNADELVVTNGTPSLGGNPMSLVNDGSSTNNTPTLAVKFLSPGPGSFKPQGTTSASLDPMAQNVSFWANWRSVKATYRAKKKVTKLRYRLQVSPPGALSCDYNY